MVKKIRLLIIEEHSAVRHALEVRMRSSARIELVAVASSLVEGQEMVRALRPDVTLLGCKGSRNEQLFCLMEAVHEMVVQQTIIIALAPFADEIEREMLLQSGVSRYLLKDINTPQLINEVEGVLMQRQGNSRARYPAEYPMPANSVLPDGSILRIDLW